MADDVTDEANELASSHLRSSRGLFHQKRSHSSATNNEQDVANVSTNQRSAVERYALAYFPPQRGGYQEREVATFEDKITSYNRRMSLDAFKVKPIEVCSTFSTDFYDRRMLIEFRIIQQCFDYF